jgi:transmembrane sensor
MTPKNNLEINREIALWIIRLNCDDPTERAHAQAEFTAWQKKHPQYLDYFTDLDSLNAEIHNLPQQHAVDSQTVQQTLLELQQGQKHILKKIGKSSLCIAIICSMCYIASTHVALDYYLADYKTAIARPQNILLEDGSKITLGAKSAINLDFDAQHRHIELIQGELYIDVAKDSKRPLVIYTSQGNFTALGTQFILQGDAQRSTLNMLESKVNACTKINPRTHCQVIQSGQSVILDQYGIRPLNIDIAQVETAWRHQQILAQQMPLSEVLERLNTYHRRYIIFNADQLSQIKVTGIINQHQDLDSTFSLLTTLYPQVEFIHLGKWITYVRLK